jgi:hypothetical protein
MAELKKLTKEGISRALEKVERYRLLNEPSEAESICRDILAAEPGHQKALCMLILSISDQFGLGAPSQEATRLLREITDNYQRTYYEGIILERLAKAALHRNMPGSGFDAYEWIEEAMSAFSRAIELRPAGNDDAILRWNSCIRLIEKNKLVPREKDLREPALE